MSNTNLSCMRLISPNRDSPRNHKIDTISIHCVVGQMGVEALCNEFSRPSKGASCNYGIGYDGRIGTSVDEEDRSWCTSSWENDNRAMWGRCPGSRLWWACPGRPTAWCAAFISTWQSPTTRRAGSHSRARKLINLQPILIATLWVRKEYYQNE